jgi:hypothetical protein
LRGHLRLTAATALLKVAVFADNEKEISNTAFENIAYVVQVSRCSSRPKKTPHADLAMSSTIGSLLPGARSVPVEIAQTSGAKT